MIGWSIFPDFFDILLADDPKALRVVMDSMYRHGHAGIFNKLYKKMMEKSELVKWNLMHGMYAYDAADPVGYVQKIRKFTLKGIGDKITQDMLILAGRDDHMIMPALFHEEFDLLPNVRSLALQLYTNADDAGSHCNMGNMKLALDTMIRWIDLIYKKMAKNVMPLIPDESLRVESLRGKPAIGKRGEDISDLIHVLPDVFHHRAFCITSIST